MAEETIIKILDLPEGKDCVWYGDANVLALSSRLDQAGRDRVLDEFQVQWRRAHIRIVDVA